MKVPEDVADGIISTLLKNISSSDLETVVSMVTTSSKPRVVKLKIHAEGKQAFTASGEPLEATHYTIHTDMGGWRERLRP